MQCHVRTLDIFIYIFTLFAIGHSAAMVVQRFSMNVHLRKRNGFDSSLGIHNPFHVFSLPLFNKTDSLPVISVPPSFLFAARGIKEPSGKMFMDVTAVVQMPSTVFGCFAENDSVVVVNMVMNNIGNYLPTDVDG